MRIPGFGGKVLAGVGAVPTNIPAGELYQALERGTIDALEWVGPSLDLRMGFHKVAPFYYTGWHEPSTELMYFFNQEKMNSLPDWAQSVLLNSAKLTGFNMTVLSQHESAENWASMKKEFPNIVVKNFPADVIEALKASNQALLDTERSRSKLAADIIESQASYLAKVRRWTEIGDWSYLANIARTR
jgi:TRAP-type mannitol/chloroaromatic compound transport system substrate-binding protein